jgi:hypothetical protein
MCQFSRHVSDSAVCTWGRVYRASSEESEEEYELYLWRLSLREESQPTPPPPHLGGFERGERGGDVRLTQGDVEVAPSQENREPQVRGGVDMWSTRVRGERRSSAALRLLLVFFLKN